MTSKIVVNNIEADAGISTVTFNSKVASTEFVGNLTGNVTSSGVTTVTSLRIGTGASISSPVTNVLALGTNDSERVRIDSSGLVGIGSDSPTAPLNVLNNNANTPTVWIQNVSGGGDSPALRVQGGANNNNTVGTFEVRDYDGNVDFKVGGTGFVGIGTDNSNSRQLSVYGPGINGTQIECRATGGNSSGLSMYAGRNFEIQSTTSAEANYPNSFIVYDRDANGYRMAIDGSGRVRTPDQPYARVYYRSATNLNYTTGNTYTVVFNSVDANVGSHYSTSNGRFTCPVAGTYLVMTALQFSVPSQSSWAYNVLIRVNNSAYAGVYQGTPSATAYESGEAYAIVNVSANDYIDIGVAVNSNIGHEVSPGDVRNYLMIYLLG